jgi:chromosome segregation ATPase
MKNRISLIVLVVICLGLAVGMVLVKNQANEQKESDTRSILSFSNQVTETTGKLEEQKQVATMLEKDLQAERKNFGELTNNFTKVSSDLAQTSANLEKTEVALKSSQEEVAKRNARITQLESQNQELDKQALDLSTAITNLNVQIAETQRKLLASEGDKALLEQELKRMRGEKAELERQFNDLTVMRAQVAKLKEELNIARRVEWIRNGLLAASDDKGATRLLKGLTTPQKSAKPNFDLNVEVSADGTVKVLSQQTNRPPAIPSPRPAG